jgi:hypothetical protein
VSPVRYKLGFYIPEDGILHRHRRENLESYISSILADSEINPTNVDRYSHVTPWVSLINGKVH